MISRETWFVDTNTSYMGMANKMNIELAFDRPSLCVVLSRRGHNGLLFTQGICAPCTCECDERSKHNGSADHRRHCGRG